MKKKDMIDQLVKIYDTRPNVCSSYHIVDMLLYAAERRGMTPPNKFVRPENWANRNKIWKNDSSFPVECFQWEEEEEDD